MRLIVAMIAVGLLSGCSLDFRKIIAESQEAQERAEKTKAVVDGAIGGATEAMAPKPEPDTDPDAGTE